MTINKVWWLRLKAVMLAAQAIRNGDAEIVIAGGQENMSASPSCSVRETASAWAMPRSSTA